MEWINLAASRLRALFLRERILQDTEAELRSHIELEMESNINCGMRPEEARAAALSSFGNLGRACDLAHEIRGAGWMDEIRQDLRYGLRQLRIHPGFTAIAALSLALGIGANTALFSLADTVLLKTLPVRNPEELVIFNWASSDHGLILSHNGTTNPDRESGLRVGSSLSYSTFLEFRAKSRTLSTVFGFAPLGDINVYADGLTTSATGQLVTGDFHRGLGVPMALGRPIINEDDSLSADPVAVISYRYWERRFGLDPSVLGKKINVNNLPCVIVGVTPPRFYAGLQVGDSPDLSLPLSVEPRIHQGLTGSTDQSLLSEPWTWWVQVMGRMKSGVDAATVQAELEGVLQKSALEGLQMAPPSERPPDVEQLRNPPRLMVIPGERGLAYLREAYKHPLIIMMIVVGLTLLVACANIANLLLARATSRRREIAMRLALGAGRFRLIRQLLTESMLLASLGGALGCLLAWWSNGLFLMWRPYGTTTPDIELQLDWRVFGFTALIAVFTGFLFGLSPAFRATRIDLNLTLKEDLRVGGRSISHFGKSLVVAQVAVSLALLVGAGLFLRTLHKLRSVELGINPENLLLFRVEPRANGYKDDQISLLCIHALDRIKTIPGVRSAAVSEHALLSGSSTSSSAFGGVQTQTISHEYFKTMGIPLLAGRSLSALDDEHAPRVAIINQTMARRLFGDENPLGQRIGFGKLEAGSAIEIVGVARDAVSTSLRQTIPATIYFPIQQKPLSRTVFAVRTASDPRQMIAALREAISNVDQNLPIIDVKTQGEQADQMLMKERFLSKLAGFFGLLTLLLAAVELYGVMSYMIAQRTREIGLRLALGASPKDLRRRVIGQGMSLAALGVAIGSSAAFALTRLVSSDSRYELMRFISGFLYGVRPTDPLTYIIVILLLLLVALLACWLPARRAMKVDPMIALRCE
jgi:predicted permease